MKKLLFPLAFVFATINCLAQSTTLTDSLTKQYFQAWNNNDTSAIISMLQPNAFFESPYQLRYGRDSIAATVLKSEIYMFYNIKTVENYSYVGDNIAWSLGKATSIMKKDKNKKSAQTSTDSYTFVYTKKSNENWKLQMIIWHEK
jgi:hypothetical protein